MTQARSWSRSCTLLAVALVMEFFGPQLASAQSDATAVQPLAISAFGMGTGTYTDVLGGRNLGITAGADLSFLTFRRLRPSLELRGNYPFYNGQVDNQHSLLGGLKVERQSGPFHPYADFLLGRGSVDYPHGLLNGNLLYLRTVSTVYSPGIGLDFDVTREWSAKIDLQYQHWDTPAIPGGVIHPKAISAGAIYRFDFNRHYRAERHAR